MGEAGIRIPYCYKSEKYSDNAIRHLFRYISAVSGIKFNWDENSPAVSNIGTYQSAKYRIAEKNDELARILSQLTFTLKMGPYSNEKHRPSDEPLLSENIQKFIGNLMNAGLVAENWPAISLWPERSSFGLAVTHDVDILRRSIFGGLRLWVNGHLPGGLKAIADSVKWRLGIGRNPYNCFDLWQKLETDGKFKSTYFIFAGPRQHNFDPVYQTSWISFERIEDRAIALHSSIGCYMGQGLCEPRNQLESLSKSRVVGIRPHYLSAYLPEFWQAAYDSGFEYSSTLGFDDAIGYLRGLDLPYYPFDISSDKPLSILEIPIAIMDCGLIGNSDALADDVVSKGYNLLERSAKSGGLIVLDWHQRTLYNRDYPGWGSLFGKLIDRAKSNDAHFTTLEEINASMKSKFDTAA
jgi:hypothetical protein